MTPDPDGKRCSGCGETKPATAFHRNKRTADGRQGWCKPCLIAAFGRSRTVPKVVEAATPVATPPPPAGGSYFSRDDIRRMVAVVLREAGR